jgi:hypothetical protein
MLYQVVCISCGYRHAWTVLTDAIADGHHHEEHRAGSSIRPAAPVAPLQHEGAADGSDQAPPD